jgi:membrane associated rhomboid family serine protease
VIPLHDDLGPRGLTPLTWLLLASWVLGYGLALDEPLTALAVTQRDFGLDAAAWHERLALVGRAEGFASVLAAAALLIPLVGHQFLHGAPLALLANVFAFSICGARLEHRAGSLRFLVFHVFVGVAAALAELRFGSSNAAGIATGASGAVAGSLSAYLVLRPKAQVRILFLVVLWPVFLSVPALVLATAWAALHWPHAVQLLALPGSRPLDPPALLAGAAAGLVGLPLLRARHPARGRRRR